MRKYIAEMIGTFILIFCGTGAIIINQETGGVITHPGVAATWGLVVMALIYAFGEISGAHLNPAVSLSFAVAGRFPFKEVAPYAAGQLLGAFAASGLLRWLFPANEALGASLPAGSALQSIVLEFVLSFTLMLVILNVSQGSKETGLFAGVAIGGVVLLEAMFAGPICGASMNPTRSIAPALVSGQWRDLWVYVVGPTAGMLSAVVAWKYLKDS